MAYRMVDSTDGYSRTYVFDSPQPKRPAPPVSPTQGKKKKKGGTAVKAVGRSSVRKSSAAVRAVKKGNAHTATAPAAKRGTVYRTPQAVVQEKKITIRTVKARERVRLPIGLIAAVMLCTVLFMGMLWSFVLVNEETIHLEKLEQQYKTIAKEEKELTLRLELKNNLKEIEEYATKKLGMVQIDQLAKKYISVASADKIERIDGNGTYTPGLVKRIDEKIREIAEYFK